MTMLLSYQRSDGLIRGVWTANNEAMLQAQVVEGDPSTGYLFVPDQDSLLLQERYVVVAGHLTPKPGVTLFATPAPFVANGTSTCTVGLSPFIACTLFVDMIPYSLVAGDPVVLVTADAPTVLHIRLPHQVACWGSPITVEAV